MTEDDLETITAAPGDITQTFALYDLMEKAGVPCDAPSFQNAAIPGLQVNSCLVNGQSWLVMTGTPQAVVKAIANSVSVPTGSPAGSDWAAVNGSGIFIMGRWWLIYLPVSSSADRLRAQEVATAMGGKLAGGS